MTRARYRIIATPHGYCVELCDPAPARHLVNTRPARTFTGARRIVAAHWRHHAGDLARHYGITRASAVLLTTRGRFEVCAWPLPAPQGGRG